MVTSGSAAQANPQAVQLFREGRELLTAGKLDEACDRFDRSARLSRKVGTLLNLGDCYEQRGKLASAWATFDDAAVLARQTSDARGAEATRRADLLKRELPYVTLVTRVPVEGLVIRQNGQPIDAATWNTAIAFDPDDYVFDASAPGYQAWSAQRTVRRRDRVELVVALILDPTAVRTPSPPPAASHPTTQELPIRPLGFGVVAGSNTRERPLIGLTALGNLEVPGGMLRGVLSAIYSRYEDNIADEGQPDEIGKIDTYFINAGLDYMWLPVATVGIAAGIGVGTEIDRDTNHGTDLGSALQVRGSAVGRLARGRVEAGLHLQLAFAGPEITLHGVIGVAWFP